jgi:hypothetical protein
VGESRAHEQSGDIGRGLAAELTWRSELRSTFRDATELRLSNPTYKRGTMRAKVLAAGFVLVLLGATGCQNSGTVTPNGVQKSPGPASSSTP